MSAMDEDLIKPPTCPVLAAGSTISPDELLTNGVILRPTKKNDSYVTFCKCDFNVKALIYEKATADDIVTRWKIANEELKLGRLVKWFLRDSLYTGY